MGSQQAKDNHKWPISLNEKVHVYDLYLTPANYEMLRILAPDIIAFHKNNPIKIYTRDGIRCVCSMQLHPKITMGLNVTRDETDDLKTLLENNVFNKDNQLRKCMRDWMQYVDIFYHFILYSRCLPTDVLRHIILLGLPPIGSHESII